ncbi:MAG: HAMP domain-containing histidine kinase [Ruminococcaceae bacterium]|nr:HAMP domain-containing histidine kinase [Oscillospiraceae bacterium]
MFKSLFTKYLFTFALIIVLSFSLLALMFSMIISNYSAAKEELMVTQTLTSVKNYVEEEYKSTISANFNQFVYLNLYDIRQMLEIVSGYSEDMVILICDTEGNVLLTDKLGDGSYIVSQIPSDYMSDILNGTQTEYVGTLDGLLTEKHEVRAEPIVSWSGEDLGAVLVGTSAGDIDQLLDVFVRMVIMACLWVLFAALIAVYIISNNIIRPLKNMSKAAKRAASGDFSVRVPVSGRDEIADLATAFNNMAASMENLESMRSSFLASVAHDLRTPMTTISGFIDGIIDGKIPPEKYDYYLTIIQTEVRRLSRLVASLLDLTRLEAGDRKFTFSEFDICEMARQILISFEQKIDSKHLDVEFDCEEDRILVNADHDAIYQIFYNICDNAVKFAREGGKYRISLIRKEKKVYVSVYNEGQGIAAEELSFVFDRFYKSDKSRGTDKTGVGLGLYIAKTIIASHKEEIWVKSAYGEYCEFVFTLSTVSPTKPGKNE